MSNGARTRRTRIVATARQRFTARGYDGTSIGDLAGELAISKAAIAYYFPTKERFLDELVEPFLDRLEASLHPEMSPREAVDVYLAALEDHHDVAVWLDRDTALQNNEEFGGRLDELNKMVVRIITGRSRRKADRIRALAVLGGLWRPTRELEPDELRDHHDDIVDAALAAY